MRLWPLSPQGQAEDAVDVVGAAGEEADDVRHHAGVVIDVDFQHGTRQCLVFLVVGGIHVQAPIMSRLAAPGGTMG